MQKDRALSDRDGQMIGEKFLVRQIHVQAYTWVQLYAENGEFRAGNVRNWRKFIERPNEHQEYTGHKLCFKDAKEIIASEAKQDDSLLSV